MTYAALSLVVRHTSAVAMSDGPCRSRGSPRRCETRARRSTMSVTTVAPSTTRSSSAIEPLRTALALSTLRLADAGKQAALRNYAFFLCASAAPPNTLERLSPYAALRSARHAARTVPAYRELL